MIRAKSRIQEALALGKLKDLSVSFLSLVKTPATGKGLTLKSANPNDRVAVFELAKTDDERMIAYGVVYAPDQEDAHGDTADAKTIRRAAYEFMREARLKNIDTEHSFTTEMAFVAESWLVRKNDALFPDEPEGAWAVGIQIGDPDLWAQLKSGDLTGISLAGIAQMEPSEPRTSYTEKDEIPGWFKSLFKQFTKQPTEETDMDKNEVQGVVRDMLKEELPGILKDAGIGTGSKPAAEDVEKAKATLKAAGIEVDAPAAGGKAAEPAGEATDIATAIAKGFEAIEGKIDDKITLAVAKGADVTGQPDTAVEESFV